ncbi:hypothetical protein ACJKIH_03050 [Brucella pseudogrignonensis]|uniref:hypothetical protein n=1 Tax=Brucella pseudogrignonensis TaxID=419475 RepID=UPI0038B645EC
MTHLKISQDNGVTTCTFQIEDSDLHPFERVRLNHADAEIPYLSAMKAAAVLESVFRRLYGEAIDKALDQ